VMRRRVADAVAAYSAHSTPEQDNFAALSAIHVAA
jgi:hypothetical protein